MRNSELVGHPRYTGPSGPSRSSAIKPKTPEELAAGQERSEFQKNRVRAAFAAAKEGERIEAEKTRARLARAAAERRRKKSGKSEPLS